MGFVDGCIICRFVIMTSGPGVDCSPFLQTPQTSLAMGSSTLEWMFRWTRNRSYNLWGSSIKLAIANESVIHGDHSTCRRAVSMDISIYWLLPSHNTHVAFTSWSRSRLLFCFLYRSRGTRIDYPTDQIPSVKCSQRARCIICVYAQCTLIVYIGCLYSIKW